MSVPRRVRGVKILKAVSSPIRLQILNLLFDRGSLSYTELMSLLKMNPSRDAGRFAYHLKFLLKADLIEADVETKKYCLTELGKMVIDVADKIEKRAYKPKGMLVRTSKFSLEEFDVNKIASSLMREAKMPAELAHKMAKEAEKRLLKAKTRYLTAPLVREVVNAILIEKGLEEYRHKLTRLGLPVHDVTTLLEFKAKSSLGAASIAEMAGETVLREYTLLNVLPRDIADAHLSGSLHVGGLSGWILKPSQIMHDLRFFLQRGLDLEKIDVLCSSYPPPQNLESALSIIFNVAVRSAKETDETQTFEYFNVFLAPFVRGLDLTKVKEALRLFIINLSQHVNASLSVELTIPDFISDKQAYGFNGENVGYYGEFLEECQLLALVIIDIFTQESSIKPVFNPKLIIKIRPEALTDEHAKAILLKAHQLASERGVPYFANLSEKSRKHSVFSAYGCKLAADINGDWEIDTLRTGCLGSVAVNMPRIAYECEGDKNKFFEILKERLEMATRALEIKYRALKQHGKGFLPFIMQSANGDQYFRLENCSRTINLVGLKEAVETICMKSVTDEQSLDFMDLVAQNVSAFTHKMSARHGKRLFPAEVPCPEASERFAQLDIERYGVGKVKFSGTRERPFYSSVRVLNLKDGDFPQELLAAQRKLNNLSSGGSLTVVELEEMMYDSDKLLSLTNRLLTEDITELFVYNRKLTYCTNCKRSWSNLLHKCPSCGSVNTLTFFNRFATA
ncbi:MAG: anaerobic ribonucleoside-triphosphate reductase [Candidatus Bathyarchaeales archaeon]